MSEKYLGENIPKLGFGLMRLPRKSNGASANPMGGEIDIEHVKQMVDYFLDNGYTYFDTAFVYDGSEEAAREALVKRHPRDKYTLASKLNLNAMMGGSPFAPATNPPSVEDGKKKLEEQFATTLSRLGTDYLDFYLLHGLNGPAMENVYKYGALDFIQKLKAEGKVRHCGFSFHGTPEDLDMILSKHPELEFVQLQLNYIDWEGDVRARELYETARKHNTPIVVMEPIKGGTLANDASVFAKYFKSIAPDVTPASYALRYVAELEGILTILSGMSEMSHMTDNVNTFNNRKPFTDEDRKAIAAAVESINSVPSVPCTSCNYCKVCPQNIPIPGLMALYNDYLVYGQINRMRYNGLMGQGRGPAPAADPKAPPPGKPSDCVSCLLCEGECPQQIGISDLMKKIADLVG